ncbi:c-type cytochrome [Spiractinospora alimapuensis]|uniref:cytochrome bc1 complex diheme cytochrome c subunit n=1 Tax=Spiractinospora alimapuensis TaxID=2820884 RepID=UPI001F34810A|nr:c-type cytochrome [Spiractinospora alimapuensis]QVQ53237.1 c-type cytochrome [Spiractinospora alimapuensis]
MKWITARRRHPLAGYAVVLLALALFGVGYAAFVPNADRAQAQSQAADVNDDVDISEGREIYIASCMSCHGDDGLGYESNEDLSGPSLEGVGAAAVNFQVSTGRMPSMDPDTQMPRKDPAWDQQQTANLAAYVQAEFGGGPEIPLDVPGEAPDPALFDSDAEYEAAVDAYEDAYSAYVAGGDIDAGQTLYLTNCAHCHSWSGGGGALTDGHIAPPLTESTPRQIYEAMLTGPGYMPVFNDETLEPQEKQDLITHVKELQMEPNAGGIFDLNRVGQTAEGYMSWVVGLALIVAAAAWITAKQRAHD